MQFDKGDHVTLAGVKIPYEKESARILTVT